MFGQIHRSSVLQVHPAGKIQESGRLREKRFHPDVVQGDDREIAVGVVFSSRRVVTTTVRHFTTEARTVTTGLHHFSPVPTATTCTSVVQESLRRTTAFGSTASLFEAFSNLPSTSFHRARHIQARQRRALLGEMSTTKREFCRYRGGFHIIFFLYSIF